MIVIEADVVHPFASVTVTEKAPAAKAVNAEAVDPLFQLKTNGVVPPVMLGLTAPFDKPHVVCVGARISVGPGMLLTVAD